MGERRSSSQRSGASKDVGFDPGLTVLLLSERASEASARGGVATKPQGRGTLKGYPGPSSAVVHAPLQKRSVFYAAVLNGAASWKDTSAPRVPVGSSRGTGFDSTRDTIFLGDTGPAPLATSAMTVAERASTAAALVSSLPSSLLNIFMAVSSFEPSVIFRRIS